MKKTINSFKGQKDLTFIIISFLVMILLSTSPAAASVSDWSFSPQYPVSGDILTIKGNADSGEKVDISVNFETNVPVSAGKFEYVLEDVKIPDGFNNLFTVEAVGVKNLNVRMKTLDLLTKSSEAAGDTAVVSQSGVPPGNYEIMIDGDAGEGISQVNLKIKASQGIEADSSGNFSFSYDTKSIPPGDFEISVGGIKKLAILPKEVPESANLSLLAIKFTDKIVYVLNHTSDPSEGNWITMGSPDDGRRVQLPQPINIAYSGPRSEEYGGVFANLSSDSDGNYTMNYPSTSSYTTFPVYLPDDKVNMSFFGDSSLKGKVDIYVLNVTSKSVFGILEAFNNGNLGNLDSLFCKSIGGNYTKYSAVLGENGDLLNHSLGSYDPGQYCIVMIQENGNNTLTVLSATAFIVAAHDLHVVAPTKIEKGDDLDISMEPVNALDSSNYTYGAVLVNEQTYRANIELNSNGTKNGTSLMINGVKVIDKFDINASNYGSKLTKNELQKEIQTLIGEGNGSLAIGETGQKNLSLTTSELPEGHYYLFAGAYDPKREIAGLTQLKIEITSLPTPTLPVANFTNNITSGYAPLSVQFMDTSENATGRTWDFENDGKADSTDQNPINVYTTPGSYTVNLTVNNANGTDSKLAAITVLEPSVKMLPVANFSSNVTSGYSPLSVQFTDRSENAVRWNWDFGDGVNSVERNPEHIYSVPGSYTVILNVSNSDGTDLKSSTINVLEKVMGPYAYITNYFNNTVSVIDTATNTVTDTVNVGSNPFGVAVSPDGANVYVTNRGSNNVSVIDAATNTVVASVNVGKRPYGIAVSPEGSKVYVTNEYSNTVSVIDTATNTVVATLPVGSWPSGVAVSPDGKTVYVVNEDGTVSVVDAVTNAVKATVEVGNNTIAIAVSPDGTKVYVTNYLGNDVSIIDTATNTVTSTVEVGSCPGGIAVSPDGAKVYVTNELSSNLSVIDTATNAVIATVEIGNSLWGVAVSPDGSKVYVANENSDNVSVIDTTANMITATVKVGSGPIAFGKFVGPVRKSVPVCNTSKIYGYCFNDSNMDKEKNTEETGLSGMTINLHGYDTCKGRLVSKTMETNSTGYFEFEGIDPGIYVVSESFVFGWLPTTNAAYTLIVPENSTSIRSDFGNTKFAK